MKRLRKIKVKKTARTSSKEPLAEGIIVPLDKQGRRIWKSMSDELLIEYAEGIIEKQGIKSRGKLQLADSGMYDALKKRELVKLLGLKKTRRNWASMSDEEFVQFANRMIKENGIRYRNELTKADIGLYSVLHKRKLLDKLEFDTNRRRQRRWSSMDDTELIRYAKHLIKNKKINKKNELRKEDGGLYEALRRRKLLDKLVFDKVRRIWESMSDEEIIMYAMELIKEKGIRNKKSLEKADKGLNGILRKRNLFDRLKFEEERRDWASMGDDELVEHAKRVIEEEGIKGRNGLQKEYKGLYDALRRRKLLDRVGLEKKKTRKPREWASMSDDDLVDYARRFIEEKRVKKRGRLAKVDSGLYEILRKRELLDRVFAPLERDREKQAVQDVFDALQEFGRN